MAIGFNIKEDLDATEAAIVDWKRRAKEYEANMLPVPDDVQRRIKMLKKDAMTLRSQLDGE